MKTGSRSRGRRTRPKETLLEKTIYTTLDRNSNVGVGTDVNTKESRESNYRIVIFVLDNGYIIPKGRGRYMFVTWGMLKKCWEAMNKKKGEYDIKAFEDHYPKYPDCYVQTVHMIFKEAGLT